RFPPPAIGQIPGHGLLQTVDERRLGPPAQLAAEFGRIDGVAEIVPRTVGHELDERAARTRRQTADGGIERIADALDNLEVAALLASSDRVGFTDASALYHLAQRARVVIDVDPIAHIAAVAVNRNPLARKRLDDRQGNQLFGKLVRSVIVAA